VEVRKREAAMLLISSLCFVLVFSLGLTPRASALTPEPAYCSSLAATNPATTWDGTTATCTEPGTGLIYQPTSGTFEVTAGTTFDMANEIDFLPGSTFMVDSGASVITQPPPGPSASRNFVGAGGAMINDGIITIQIAAGDSIELDTSTFTNHGTINIQNHDPVQPSEGIDIGRYGLTLSSPHGTLINDGTINVENYGPNTYGIYNNGVVTNTGTIQTVFATTGITGTVFNACGGEITGFADYIQQAGCTTSSVPEFPFGLALLFTIMVPALLVLRKKAMSFRRLSV
jgi:hypothetical protein